MRLCCVYWLIIISSQSSTRIAAAVTGREMETCHHSGPSLSSSRGERCCLVGVQCVLSNPHSRAQSAREAQSIGAANRHACIRWCRQLHGSDARVLALGTTRGVRVWQLPHAFVYTVSVYDDESAGCGLLVCIVWWRVYSLMAFWYVQMFMCVARIWFSFARLSSLLFCASFCAFLPSFLSAASISFNYQSCFRWAACVHSVVLQLLSFCIFVLQFGPFVNRDSRFSLSSFFIVSSSSSSSPSSSSSSSHILPLYVACDKPHSIHMRESSDIIKERGYKHDNPPSFAMCRSSLLPPCSKCTLCSLSLSFSILHLYVFCSSSQSSQREALISSLVFRIISHILCSLSWALDLSSLFLRYSFCSLEPQPYSLPSLSVSLFMSVRGLFQWFSFYVLSCCAVLHVFQELYSILQLWSLAYVLSCLPWWHLHAPDSPWFWYRTLNDYCRQRQHKLGMCHAPIAQVFLLIC